MKRFWIAQGLGWGLYVLANFLFTLDAGADPVRLFGQKALKGGIGLGISLILAALYGRLWARQTGLAALAVVGALASLGLGVAWLLLVRLAYLQAPLGPTFARDALSHVFALIAWSGIYFTIRTTERAAQATALAKEAQLRMLRYQVNPHFFFNALNAIRALIDESPARARQTVTELSELFRYSLLEKPETSFGEELAAIRNYLAIQKIRFEDQLEVRFDVAPEAESVVMPSFLVHPLVENAVKHGLASAPPPLHLSITAAVTGDRLVVTVTNDGRLGGGGAPGTGTGLHNIRERLAARWPGRHALRLEEKDGQVVARLEIPR